MAFLCRRFERLMIAAAAGQASDAERLALEEHLAECESCRALHASDAPLRRLKDWEPPRLNDAARQRVRAAFEAAAGQQPPVEPRRPRVTRIALAVAAAASLAIGLGVGFGAWRGDPLRVASGGVELAQAGDGTHLDSTAGGRVLVDHVVIDLAPGSAAIWRAAEHALHLERGQVTVEVERRRAPFFVRTSQFSVEVLGTKFEVALDRVATLRGHVQVHAPKGELLADLRAGQTWTLPRPPSAAPAAPATLEPATATTTAAPAPTIAAPPTSPLPRETQTAPRPPRARPQPPAATTPDDRERLAQARSALSRGAAEDARGILDKLEGAPPPMSIEAQLLRAESYLIERRYRDAVDQYKLVVRRFPSSPQAESALYALAQLELERDRSSEGFRRYLERYPSGRFAIEARARIPSTAP